jgi:hypothetical protein
MNKKKAEKSMSKTQLILDDKNCRRLEELSYDGIDSEDWYPSIGDVEKIGKKIKEDGDGEDIEFLYWLLNHFVAFSDKDKATEARIREILELP